MADDEENTGPPYFSPDVVLEILVRLPPSARRRCRFVCRSWRDAVDTHTTEMQSRAKPLVATTGLAYVVDDLSAPARSRLLWKDGVAHREEGTSVVGTCNGLICLCDNRESGGAITLINPATDETLAIPPLPCAPGTDACCWHEKYSFAYHPTTGRYNVVHLPCYYDRARVFRSVQVFTLGEASWRDVVTPPAAICNRSAGVVSVDGATYWVVNGTKKIMRLDLGDERVTSVQSIPSVPSGCSSSWHLMEVHGKLGIAFAQSSPVPDSKTEVWALEVVTAGEHRWSHMHTVQLKQNLALTRPHFFHGEAFLTQGFARDVYGRPVYVVYEHSPSEDTRKRRRGEEDDIIDIRHGKMISCTTTCGRSCDRRTFSYVGTTEPFASYMPSLLPNIE